MVSLAHGHTHCGCRAGSVGPRPQRSLLAPDRRSLATLREQDLEPGREGWLEREATEDGGAEAGGGREMNAQPRGQNREKAQTEREGGWRPRGARALTSISELWACTFCTMSSASRMRRVSWGEYSAGVSSLS